MMKYLVELFRQPQREPPRDISGRQLIDLDANFKGDNLSMPYRGGDFVSSMQEADGGAIGYMWPLPYAGDDVGSAAALKAVERAIDRKNQTGSTAQILSGGINSGVFGDGY